MTPEELRNSDPALFAAVVAIGRAEATALAATHLKFGAKCTDFELAHKAIRTGAPLDAEHVEAYTDSYFRKMGIDQRQAETDAAGAILDGAVRSSHESSSNNESEIEGVARELERLMGPPPAESRKAL